MAVSYTHLDMEKQIAVLQGQLKQAFGTKSRLERQMDTLDINDAHYDRKILDLQRRYDEQYDTCLLYTSFLFLTRKNCNYTENQEKQKSYFH